MANLVERSSSGIEKATACSPTVTLQQAGPPSKTLQAFDDVDASAQLRELLARFARLSASGAATTAAAAMPWKWDLLDAFADSRDRLRGIRQFHAQWGGAWREVRAALMSEQDASTLPVNLRKQCEDMLARQPTWVQEFDTEFSSILARGSELREHLLFEAESTSSTGWFAATAPTVGDATKLLERHLDLHQRAGRLEKQLQLLSRSLRQQGAISSRRRAFAERTVGDKLQSSLVTLAAAAVVPVPGSSELWLASTAALWLSSDQAWQHVVYEHPRDTDTESVLKNQFQCSSVKAQESLATWFQMPAARRRGCCLVHNASIRRVALKTHLVNCIDGQGDVSKDWTTALDHHPLGSVVKKAWGTNSEQGKVVIGAQRLAVIKLPRKPDANWSWRGLFSYGDAKVGECSLREGGIFSFICVDCGLRVADRGEEDHHRPSVAEVGAPALVEETDESTTLEVVNNVEDLVQVKVYMPSAAAGPALFFRKPLGEGSVAPGARCRFRLPTEADRGPETNFDVEVKVAGRKAKCEVVGEQIVFVDGIFSDV